MSVKCREEGKDEIREVGAKFPIDGEAISVVSPPSGLRLILEVQGTQVPETPPSEPRLDPLKKLEANSLFGL